VDFRFLLVSGFVFLVVGGIEPTLVLGSVKSVWNQLANFFLAVVTVTEMTE